MAINKYMRAALKALSYGEPDLTGNYEMVRKIKELKRGVGAGLAYRTWDHLGPLRGPSRPGTDFCARRRPARTAGSALFSRGRLGYRQH